MKNKCQKPYPVANAIVFFLFFFILIGKISGKTNDPPVILIQPQSQTVTEGDPVNIFVAVSGTEPFTYYWYKDGNFISGTNDSILVLDPLQLADSGMYHVTIINPFGSVTSDTAKLTVLEGIHFAPESLKVFASAGETYYASNFTLSTTIGESVVGTYNSTTNKLTTGFQQPRGKPFAVDLNVFLEGPFTGSVMSPLLNIQGYVPADQPYNNPPWNYTGSESVDLPLPSTVVDWLLIELRRTTGDASTATSDSIVSRKVALLYFDGTVTGIDGVSPLFFSLTRFANMYIVVWHRNHLGIMSAFPLVENQGIYSYDFTTGEQQVYGGGNGHKELAPGIWGMISADGNADGQISNTDKNSVWAPQAGNSGYLSGDFNLDGQVGNPDKNNHWVPNSGSGNQVPDFNANGYESQVP